MPKQLKIISIIAILYTSSAIAETITVEDTLRSIDNNINSTVKVAQELFENNQGQSMIASVNNLHNTNPYLRVLKITHDYNIAIKFNDMDTYRARSSSPIAQDLHGVDIILVPVYNKGDDKIDSWECVTNADQNISESTASITKEYTTSYISKASSGTYLSLCTFIDRELVE